jgi:hypothetical protein
MLLGLVMLVGLLGVLGLAGMELQVGLLGLALSGRLRGPEGAGRGGGRCWRRR